MLADDVYQALRAIYRPTAKAKASGSQLPAKLQRLVAVDQEQVVGTVKFFIEDRSLRVIGLAVAEKYRGRGVARAIIGKLVEIGTARGASRLGLYTVPAAGAVPFYEKLGFRVVRECEEGYMESPDGCPLVEVFMERDL